MKAFFNTLLYRPLYNVFIFLVGVMPGHNLGLAIIALTILVRLVLTPVKFKAIEAQVKQRDVQPELKRIQEQHKDDKQAQNMATMQLYKDKGINPASGCLPLLIQFPILIILYTVFRHGLGAADHSLLYSFVKDPGTINSHFLWLKDLSKTDPTFVLPVLAGAAQFFFSRSMMASMPQSTDPNDTAAIMTKQMTYLFPVMTILIARSLPAALSLYWVAATLVDWLQQVIGMRRVQSQPNVNKTTVTVRKKKEAA